MLGKLLLRDTYGTRGKEFIGNVVVELAKECLDVLRAPQGVVDGREEAVEGSFLGGGQGGGGPGFGSPAGRHRCLRVML